MTISHKRNRRPSIVNLSKGITRRMPAEVFSSCKTSNIGASYSSMTTTNGFPFFDMHDELAQSAKLQGLFHFYSFHIGKHILQATALSEIAMPPHFLVLSSHLCQNAAQDTTVSFLAPKKRLSNRRKVLYYHGNTHAT